MIGRIKNKPRMRVKLNSGTRLFSEPQIRRVFHAVETYIETRDRAARAGSSPDANAGVYYEIVRGVYQQVIRDSERAE